MATILVAEGGPMNRHFVATLLRERGHRVIEVSPGEDAWSIVKEEGPDLVLIDILMPGLDIAELISRLRSESVAARPRILFRAADYVEPEASELARALGIPFLAKPDNPGTLLKTVDAALAAPERRPVAQERAGASKSVDKLLRPLLGKLCRHVAELEEVNAEVNERLVEGHAQLDVARFGLDQEINKRLWAEQELTLANLRLRNQAVRDGLTGLYNRSYMEESLDREESRAKRGGYSLGVMLVDVDHFKRINDTFGHPGGDAALRAVGRCLASAARGEDIVCRYGGDEFVLVMVQATQGILLERAERLRQSVRRLQIEFEGRYVGPVTLSIGIGVVPDHGGGVRAVLQVADRALYRAKQAGRDRVVSGDKLTDAISAAGEGRRS